MGSQRFEERGFLRRLVRDQAGLTSLEYGVIAALLAVAAIPAINALGGEVREGMDDTTSDLQAGNQAMQGNGGTTDRNGLNPTTPEEPAPVGDPLQPVPDQNQNSFDTPDEPVPAAMKAPADESVPSNGLM